MSYLTMLENKDAVEKNEGKMLLGKVIEFKTNY